MWAVGSILAEGNEEADDELVKFFEGHGYKLFNLPAVQRVVSTKFHCYTSLTYLCTFRVYAALAKYIEVLFCKFATFLFYLKCCLNMPHSGGSRGRRLGQLAAAQGTKGEGHQRGESKNSANLHDEKRD